MIDTHCHLNFQAFDGIIEETIQAAVKQGVTKIVVPGTELTSSQKATDIAQQHDNTWAAVGIHPHHIYELKEQTQQLEEDLATIEDLLKMSRVVAVGEVGIDRYYYKNTKYSTYEITDHFIKVQKDIFTTQIRLAIKHGKSLIIHNREAKDDVLEVLTQEWRSVLEGKTVIHCCEPESSMLEFAKANRCYIGTDGDITYSKKKQRFIAEVPLSMLVLETDSPFLIPEPLKSEKIFPNKPENIVLIAEKVAQLKNIPVEEVMEITTRNAEDLFGI